MARAARLGAIALVLGTSAAMAVGASTQSAARSLLALPPVCRPQGEAIAPGAQNTVQAADAACRRVVLPLGWMVRAVRGQQAPSYAVVDSGGNRFLRVSGTGRAAWFVNELRSPIAPSSGTLAWSWRVSSMPVGADLRQSASDDAPLRLFVVFERDGWLDRTPHTIFYTVGGAEPRGYARPSFQSKKLHILRVDGDATSLRWHESVVDPFADFGRIWGTPARPIVAIGIMQDTDQTRGTAEADVRAMVWRPGEGITGSYAPPQTAPRRPASVP